MWSNFVQNALGSYKKRRHSIIAGGNGRNLFKVIDKRAYVDVGQVSELSSGVNCCAQGRIQQCGETFDIRACFGYSTKLQFLDIKDVDRKASVLNLSTST